ncbi:MAG: RuBisCO large subunit C-terminal-like domain-containing protein [Thermoanaerobaculia bacterium]
MRGRLRAAFELRCPPGESPEERARSIAVEQTVEIPEGCFSEEVEARVVARLEELEPLADGRHRAVLSYPVRDVGPRIGQLVNLLFGNISMHRGIRLVAVEWPEEILAAFPGPSFGIPGLREATGVRQRPLVCAAVKPLGLSAEELARDAAAFARGGVDLVKDDHSLDDQPELAPFCERVARCQEAVSRANEQTGGGTFYVPNLGGTPDQLIERVEWLRGLGVRGVMVCPLIQGLDVVRWLADESGLFVLGHPSFTGSLLGEEHGIAAPLLYGHLLRLAGCDGVIFVNAGGRFAWSGERCDAIARALREPLGEVRPAFPVPAGGMDVRRAPEWVAHYGRDTMVLIGGSLYQQGDLAAASAALVASLEPA